MSIETRSGSNDDSEHEGVIYGRSEDGKMVVMAGGEIISVLDRDTVALFFDGDATLAELDEAPIISTEGFDG